MFRTFLILIVFISGRLFSVQDLSSLMCDLELVEYWDQFVEIHFPLTFNHQLSTGYFATPSAHMGQAGEIGVGAGNVHPYNIYAGRIQLFNHLEITGNYHVFRGVDDPVLSQYGFGDFARRSANAKLAFITPEETLYQLPGVAIGVDDFMGDRSFFNMYAVATQIFYEEGIEISFGWGSGRYTGGFLRGFFGAVNWFPLLDCHPTLKGLSVACEVDPVNYKNDPHPCGRECRWPINVGVKYNVASFLYLSAEYIRGREWALSAALNYNIGSTKGLLPKICDPPPFQGLNTFPIGVDRPENMMVNEFKEAFCCQGFFLNNAMFEYISRKGVCQSEKRLWLYVVNRLYRRESKSKAEIDRIVTRLAPLDVTEVVVVVEAMGLPIHMYRYPRAFLQAYLEGNIGDYAFCLLSYRETPCRPCQRTPLYYCPLEKAFLRVFPRYETFFGSAKGKFKYDIGVKAALEGFLYGDLFYELELSYTVYSTIKHIADLDRFNPSQLPNVNSDYVNYRQNGRFSTEKAYIQKGWHFGKGIYGRGSLGYFQVNYAGIGGELLWYPARSCVALGIEGALLKKREYTGLGFQSSLRQLEDYTPTFHHYTVLNQWFLDLYVDFYDWQIASKLSLGQFLAHDYGGRFEFTRYFDSGLRLSFWVTFTNAHDVMHGKVYFDRGIQMELPIDLFLKRSCKRVWNYGMAAWLRDAGARTSTGRSLYDTIYYERRR